jgi:hypothetical protein
METVLFLPPAPHKGRVFPNTSGVSDANGINQSKYFNHKTSSIATFTASLKSPELVKRKRTSINKGISPLLIEATTKFIEKKITISC